MGQSSTTQTIDALLQYFDRNHAYRTSGHSIADRHVAARSGTADFVVRDSHGGYLAAGQLTLASVMTAVASFGNAIVGHVNVPLLSPWSSSYATGARCLDPASAKSDYVTRAP